jgi:tetrahydromethanopterin S-methyltransferase subunit D
MATLAAVGVGVKVSKLSSGSGLKGVLTHASLRDAAAKGQQRKCGVRSDE